VNGAPASELQVSEWFNSEPLSLAGLRGRVVVLHAFQMLCPGCVLHGTPLAQRLHDRFAGPDLTVIGLHTVFEHHEAMRPPSLAAYLHEFRITMPVAVDQPSPPGHPIPRTMAAYAMRGTPTLLLIDRAGRVRHHLFGSLDELELGAHLARLIDEPAACEAETGATGLDTAGP
jgi:AhpC/TSA family